VYKAELGTPLGEVVTRAVLKLREYNAGIKARFSRATEGDGGAEGA